MDRRTFLKAAIAAPAAVAVPTWLKPLPFFGNGIASIMAPFQREINQAYYSVFMHPQCWLALVDGHVRWTWQSEYRAWRSQRKKGMQVETESELMARVRAGIGTKISDLSTYGGAQIVLAEKIT